MIETKPMLPGSIRRGGVGFVVGPVLLAGSLVGAATPAAASHGAQANFILAAVPPLAEAESGGEPTPQPRTTGPIAKRTIGYSVQGRKLVARLYGSPDATKVGVVIGSMHGTERGGIPVAKRIEALGAPAGTALWVIRNLNPDGSRINQRGNARKVDLNRNGTHIWAAKARAPVYYPGPSAASEPETRAYISFLESVKPDVVLIYHQHGNGVDSYRQKNAGLTKGLAKRMKLPVKPFNCDGECTGTLTGWFNTTQAGAALTIELTASVNTKKVNRWAKAARWSVGYVPDVNR
ncbi:MAG: M14 family zinc carboxypeptidase [Candidatus Nanopelagicales bacterium]